MASLLMLAILALIFGAFIGVNKSGASNIANIETPQVDAVTDKLEGQ